VCRIVEGGELVGKPVLLEHDAKSVVGRVEAAWEHDGRLDVVVDLPKESFWAVGASSLIAGDTIRDFSLGYKITMSAGESAGSVVCGKREVVEVSLVRKGLCSFTFTCICRAVFVYKFDSVPPVSLSFWMYC
jgi:hypothetical protein